MLLLDEPLSNLDAKLRRHVREEIRQIQQTLGLTAVYVTHDQVEAMAVSDRIIVMKDAKIAQEGTPHDLYERPNSSFIADFTGDANLIDCEVVQANGETADIVVAGRELNLPDTDRPKGGARIVIRSHQIQLKAKTPEEGFEGVISDAAYLGNQVQYTVDGVLGQLFVISNTTANPLAIGDSVSILMDPSEMRLVAE